MKNSKNRNIYILIIFLVCLICNIFFNVFTAIKVDNNRELIHNVRESINKRTTYTNTWCGNMWIQHDCIEIDHNDLFSLILDNLNLELEEIPFKAEQIKLKPKPLKGYHSMPQSHYYYEWE